MISKTLFPRIACVFHRPVIVDNSSYPPSSEKRIAFKQSHKREAWGSYVGRTSALKMLIKKHFFRSTLNCEYSKRLCHIYNYGLGWTHVNWFTAKSVRSLCVRGLRHYLKKMKVHQKFSKRITATTKEKFKVSTENRTLYNTGNANN